jgi:glycosyltransferase involved in cell wall biosynthesis
MVGKPRVSVILSFLNAERFFVETLESVIAQTFMSWELLLVDDGSTDESTYIAQGYAEKYPQKVRYFEHDKHQNRGLPVSRNVGIRNAAGEYIATLDADDVWLPNKLERQVAILDSHPEAALVYGASLYWHSWEGGAQTDSLAPLGIPGDKIYRPPELLRLTLSDQAVSPCPSDLMFRKAITSDSGGFEESFIGIFSMYEDQSFLVKVYANLPVYVSSECWDRYRVHSDQLCATVIRTGRKAQAEHLFLTWTLEYLLNRGQLDPEIKSIIRRRLWPHNHPLFERLRRAGERAATKAKRVILQRDNQGD